MASQYSLSTDAFTGVMIASVKAFFSPELAIFIKICGETAEMVREIVQWCIGSAVAAFVNDAG